MELFLYLLFFIAIYLIGVSHGIVVDCEPTLPPYRKEVWYGSQQIDGHMFPENPFSGMQYFEKQFDGTTMVWVYFDNAWRVTDGNGEQV